MDGMKDAEIVMTEEEEILRDELESFDPKYQQHYKTLYDAAEAAGQTALVAYWTFMATPAGQQLHLKLANVRDHAAENEVRRKQRESEMKLTAQGRKWFNGRG